MVLRHHPRESRQAGGLSLRRLRSSRHFDQVLPRRIRVKEPPGDVIWRRAVAEVIAHRVAGGEQEGSALPHHLKAAGAESVEVGVLIACAGTASGLVMIRVRIWCTGSNISFSLEYASSVMPYKRSAFGVLPPFWSSAATTGAALDLFALFDVHLALPPML